MVKGDVQSNIGIIRDDRSFDICLCSTLQPKNWNGHETIPFSWNDTVFSIHVFDA